MRYSYIPESAAADARAAATHTAPPEPTYVVLRAAQPYDLATPGTPDGLRQLARAAAEGGIYTAAATFALSASPDGAEVVASLALRLTVDGPEEGRRRRAWVVYVRRGDRPWSATATPAGGGAALLDTHAPAQLRDLDDGRPPVEVVVPVRPVGVLELKALLRGEVWTPPPPRPGPPRLRCYTCDKVTPYSVSTWRPYTRHKCATGVEGRS